jgi:hypothetical protein
MERNKNFFILIRSVPQDTPFIPFLQNFAPVPASGTRTGAGIAKKSVSLHF